MWLLYIFCVLLPFQFALNPLPDIDLASGRVLALLVLACGFAFALYYQRVWVSLSLLSISLGLFLVWAAASLVWAPDLLLGARKLFFLFTFASLFWVIPLIAKRNASSIEPWLIYSGALAAITALLQWTGQFIIGLEPMLLLWRSLAPVLFGQAFGEQLLARSSWLVEIGGSSIFRAVGFFPDPHTLGFYMALLIPLALSKRTYAYTLCAILCSTALLLTFSRAAYVGALTVLFVFVLTKISVKRKTQNETQQFKIQSFKFPIIILSFSLFVFSLFFTPVGARFLSSFNPWEGSNEERLANWTQALTLIQEHPVRGVGLGNYASALDELSGERSSVYAHNLYLDIAAELGLVGSALFILAASAALIKSYAHALPYFFSLVWFFAQSVFDTPLFSVHVLPLFIIMLSLVDAYDTR